MNNPNQQIQEIIYQTQCTYLYWYVFLNLLAINNIFLCWDGEQIQLLQWDGDGFVLLQKKDVKREDKKDKENAKWSRGNDVLCPKKDDLDGIPLGDIIQEHSDLNPPQILDEGIMPPQKKFDPIPLSIQANRKKLPTHPEKATPPRNSKKYKSPVKKLAANFERSRDSWKAKCTKEELKLASRHIKNLRASNKKIKKKIKCLEAEIPKLNSAKEALEQEVHELQKTVVSQVDTAQALNVVLERHQYPIGIIYMYVSLVLTASTSSALEVFISTLNFDCSIPSWTNGRLWLLRLGYYKLTRPKEIADDWIWIADHIIQLDNKKCFAICGVRQSHLSNLDRALTYEDVEPLAILPVDESSGTIVYDQLTQTIEQTGVPREIIGDHGSDLKKGIDEFCKEHPQTVYIHDIKHKTALILKHELENDEDWQEFNKLRSETKQKIKQTPLGFLNPKKSRTKARYMNVDSSIEWGINILDFVEKQAKNPSKKLDKKMIEEKLGWIRSYKESLEEWSSILKMVSITEQLIRKQGIRKKSHSSVKKELLKVPNTSKRVKNVRKELLDFVKLESLKVSLKEKLLGSSEIIESIFGKLKEVEKEQSKSGFTGLVLMLAAMVSTTSMDVLTKALESVPVKNVMDCTLGKLCNLKGRNILKVQREKSSPTATKKRNKNGENYYCLYRFFLSS